MRPAGTAGAEWRSPFLNVEITGRHVRITAGIEEYTREKVSRVAKYLKKDVRVQVVLEQEHDKHQVEMIVSGYRGPVIVSHVQHDELHAAVDLAIDKIEQQLRKLKGRRQDRQGESMAGESVESRRRAGAGSSDTAHGEGPQGDQSEDESEVSYEDVIDEELNK